MGIVRTEAGPKACFVARAIDSAIDAWRAPTAGAAVLSVYAGVLHLYVTPEHFREWWGYGVFFLGVTIAQVLFAFLVLRWPRTMTAVAGITGNLIVVGVYVLSRTNGVPVGPGHSRHGPEGVGVLDLTATAVEVILIAVLVSLMPPRIGRATVNVLLVAGLGLWALRLSGVLA
ncbi:MAG: hypothetical protein JWN29_109 [Acidimicrobiales bacterium]|nr:hypothetical protein [Acidimicrobiales bacterium]